MAHITSILFIICCISAIALSRAEINPHWEKPDAWSRHRSTVDTETAKEKPVNNNEIGTIACTKNVQMKEISAIFYKRLAQLLFEEKKFKEVEFGLVTRTIKLKLEKDRLELINFLINEDDENKLIDLDDQIVKIIKESQGGLVESIKEDILSFYEKIHNFLHEKNVQAIIYPVVFFILLPLLLKRFGWSMAISVIFIILFVGCVFHYMDCNKGKEVDQIIKFLQQKDATKTPCDGVDLSQKTWFSGQQNDCIEYMRKTAKIELDVCLPHDVLIGYAFELYSNILQRFFVGTIDAFEKTTANYSFFGRIFALAIFITLFITFAYFVLGTTVPNIFKHGFREVLNSKRHPKDLHDQTASIHTTIKDEALLTLTKLLVEQSRKPRKTLRRRQMIQSRAEDVRDGETDNMLEEDLDDNAEFETVEVPNEENISDEPLDKVESHTEKINENTSEPTKDKENS